MKHENLNYQSILSKGLWLLLFVALGCSQRGCSCKRMETIKQEIVITDRLGDTAKGKFPADFINLLYIKNLLYINKTDTLLQRFKPNVALKRLDTGMETGNVQKAGMNDWQRFIRSIFTLSPDNYDPDLEKRFLSNELGDGFSAISPYTDSLKIAAINQYLLNELREPQKCKIYFYSANIKNNSYHCNINISKSKGETPAGFASKKQQPEKNGKGFGCSGLEPSMKKNNRGIKRLDTVFQILHNIDCINFLIAKSADSVALNGSGCSVKDRTLKHIIIFEPPFSGNTDSDTSSLVITPEADTVRVCKTIKPPVKLTPKPATSTNKPNQKNNNRSNRPRVNPDRAEKQDTSAINQLRRKIINEFRELLFMYAKTQTSAEQKFFRTSALNKIREIPNVRVDIIPKNDISTFLDHIAIGSSAWALPKVTPIVDKKTFLIIGVTIEQK